MPEFTNLSGIMNTVQHVTANTNDFRTDSKGGVTELGSAHKFLRSITDKISSSHVAHRNTRTLERLQAQVSEMKSRDLRTIMDSESPDRDGRIRKLNQETEAVQTKIENSIAFQERVLTSAPAIKTAEEYYLRIADGVTEADLAEAARGRELDGKPPMSAQEIDKQVRTMVQSFDLDFSSLVRDATNSIRREMEEGDFAVIKNECERDFDRECLSIVGSTECKSSGSRVKMDLLEAFLEPLLQKGENRGDAQMAALFIANAATQRGPFGDLMQFLQSGNGGLPNAEEMAAYDFRLSVNQGADSIRGVSVSALEDGRVEIGVYAEVELISLRGSGEGQPPIETISNHLGLSVIFDPSTCDPRNRDRIDFSVGDIMLLGRTLKFVPPADADDAGDAALPPLAPPPPPAVDAAGAVGVAGAVDAVDAVDDAGDAALPPLAPPPPPAAGAVGAVGVAGAVDAVGAVGVAGAIDGAGDADAADDAGDADLLPPAPPPPAGVVPPTDVTESSAASDIEDDLDKVLADFMSSGRGIDGVGGDDTEFSYSSIHMSALERKQVWDEVNGILKDISKVMP